MKTFQIKANKKSQWAYKELKAFLHYTKQQNIDPFHILGSYAGAIGIAQFMPSNLIALGKDGNNNGTINLFEDSDAIYSVANYLKHHGWYPDISDDKAFKIIKKYNNSDQYTKTIMKIANTLLKD